MPTYPFDPSKIGAYKRSYDGYSESTGDVQERDKLSEVLNWTTEPLPRLKHPKSQLREHAKSAVETGLEVAGLPGGKRGLGLSLVDPIVDVAEDLYYAARDIFTGRRTKTSLIIVGGIVLGAVAGALIGTLVMPGIGSAIGGAMGAAAIGTFLSVGGTIGLSVLGAAGGSWLGTKISDVAFKEEKRYELSHRRTRRIKKYLGISEVDAEIINGYLINRRKTVTSPKTKRVYKLLKDELIETPDNAVISKALNFFKHELELLKSESERVDSPIPEELDKEIKSVEYILKVIVNSKEFDFVHDKSPLPSLHPAPSSTSTRVKPILSHQSHEIQLDDGLIYGMGKQKFTEKDKEAISNELAAEALAHSEATGNKSPIVVAGGDDAIAIRLLAAAIKAGLKPELDNTEFPDEAHRFRLHEDACRLAKVIPDSQPNKAGLKYTA